MTLNRTIRYAAAATLAAAAIIPQATAAVTNTVDSAYLFTYALPEGKSGLRLAWSLDGTEWKGIGDPKPIDVVKSDFGSWGSHKKMFDPHLTRTANGWMLSWYVSDKRETVAVATSPDLVKWSPQRYAPVGKASQFGTSPANTANYNAITIDGKEYAGETRKVGKDFLESLLRHESEQKRKTAEEDERVTQDPERFAGITGLNITARRNDKPALPVSPNLFGIFFEDINYSADGGLYAELIQNRDFEYSPSDCGKEGWGPTYAWTLSSPKDNSTIDIQTSDPIHPNNSHYVKIHSEKAPQTLSNTGFDGISLKQGEDYNLSFYVRLDGNKKRRFTVSLGNDDAIAEKVAVNVKPGEWHKIDLRLHCNRDMTDGRLNIEIPANTSCALDMISLFPADTYKNRRNGLRRDLAEALDSLHPRFVRFPGGCVAHGDGIDNIYDWKGSIGPLESRRPLRNLWGYHQTRGLGYHEYFEFCEDMGATPLPVLAAGVPCQNSGRAWCGSHDEHTTLGQQDGIPEEMMDQYIQDILDLIEYANGPVTSEWGAKRAANGHPEPFNLKYLGIGNEDMITEVFETRFRQIYDAVTKAHPEIIVVGTVGPFYEGTDYDEGWRIADELNIPIVDEHYYVSPGWLINNRDYYDNYRRGATKVYLGEYASHVPGRKNNMETALSIALYLTDVERNSDVVEMTSFAPLLAKKNHTQWRPDMIYFDNESLTLTPDYYVQQIFSCNQGDRYIPLDLEISSDKEDVKRRVALSAMEDTKTGAIIVKAVNMTPVNLTVDQPLIPADSECELYILSGEREDENPVYQKETRRAGGILHLAPYSMIVLKSKI